MVVPFTRTVPEIQHELQPLENIIRLKLLPALTGRPPPNDSERELFALPARLGGLGLANPTVQSSREFVASVKITDPLKNAIVSQNIEYS